MGARGHDRASSGTGDAPLDEEPPAAKKLRASSSSRASSEVRDERLEPFVPRDSLPVPFNGTWVRGGDGKALSRVVCCCSQARAPLSHGAPVWGELPSPMCRLKKKKNCTIKTRPRRAFGKRSPAPRKPKGKPGRPFVGAHGGGSSPMCRLVGVNYLRAHTRTRASCVGSDKLVNSRTALMAKLLLSGGSWRDDDGELLTPSFFRKKCAKSIPLQGAIQSESFTRKPRRNEHFRSTSAKPVIVNCRPPDYTARDGLHIADGAEPWCGPARRLASPCVGRTSGAPSCALFHSPVPGPGHVTRHSANVPWRPRFPSAVHSSMMPSRAGVSIQRA